MEKADLIIKTKMLDDFDIIDWNIADMHRVWDDDIDSDYEKVSDYTNNDTFRSDNEKSLRNVGKYIEYCINKSNIAYGWRVDNCLYTLTYIEQNDEYEHKFTIEFDSIELAENPMQLFGISCETNVDWL